MNFKDEQIWIIGASCGIGEALARELAAQGASLVLSARREEPLQALARELQGEHHVIALDVSDADRVHQAAQEIVEKSGRIDRVIFMAAVFRSHEISETDVDFAKHMVEVNFLGAIYTSYAVLPQFKQQGAGQLALCGSVAGYTGLPGGQPYCATKAALINFTESLRAETDASIDIKLISPGFVRTRITDKNNFPMPMMIEPDQAAKAIAKGLQRKAFEIHFPRGFTYVMKFFGVLPYWLKLPITKMLRGRAA